MKRKILSRYWSCEDIIERIIDLPQNYDGRWPKHRTQEFNYACSYLEREHNVSTIEHIELIKIAMKVVLKDLTTTSQSDFLYSDPGIRYARSIIPKRFDTEDATVSLKATGTKTILLSKTLVLSNPRRKDKLIHTYKNIKRNGFKYQPLKHQGEYIKELNLCCITFDGHHSITSGVLLGEGSIKVPSYSLVDLFDHVGTNGTYFYNEHTGKALMAVYDFRISILYEYAKALHNIEKEQRTILTLVVEDVKQYPLTSDAYGYRPKQLLVIGVVTNERTKDAPSLKDMRVQVELKGDAVNKYLDKHAIGEKIHLKGYFEGYRKHNRKDVVNKEIPVVSCSRLFSIRYFDPNTDQRRNNEESFFQMSNFLPTGQKVK